MRWGVVVFPGSNDDRDALQVVERVLGDEAVALWHKERDVQGVDCVILPGGFSYGDYLRPGAIARFSPVVGAVKKFADAGGLVIGICNGFQILVESGLLPGALIRNRNLRFVCRTVHLKTVTLDSPFTNTLNGASPLAVPIAHGDGCYLADEATLDQLDNQDRVAFRYCDLAGRVTDEANPNGSLHNIAGVLSEGRNVLGMMPHPERASDPAMGSTDGLAVFRSMTAALAGAAR